MAVDEVGCVFAGRVAVAQVRRNPLRQVEEAAYVQVEHLVPSIDLQQLGGLPIRFPLLASAKGQLETGTIDLTADIWRAFHTRAR